MKVRRRRYILLKLIIALILLTAILLLDSNTRIVTTEYELYYRALPETFDGYRIAALSDIHAAQFGRENERLVAKVLAAEPDIITILGDFVDSYKKVPMTEQLEIAETLVKGLLEIAPVYYITGNHEWDSIGLHALINILTENGVTVLRNSFTELERGNNKIVLAGREDAGGPADMPSREEFVEGIYTAHGSSFIIMLEHRNYSLEQYSKLGIDLVLSGHAHGGVIRLPFTDGLIGPTREWLPTYTSGVYTAGHTKMVVSRGIGNHTGFPRFLNNPHIAVAVLKAQRQS